jgi:hypothetical protein
VLAVIGLVILGYVGVIPQKRRQARADARFRETKIAEYKIGNSARLKAEYERLKAEERQRWTQEHFVESNAEVAVSNRKLEFPEIRMTDTRYIVIGTALSASVVLLQSLFPAC